MAEKGSQSQAAQAKIGSYLLGDTLGVGSFGKVKSKSLITSYFIPSFQTAAIDNVLVVVVAVLVVVLV